MLKFAVIGCGNIAQRASIPALIESEVTEIVVCIDINPEIAEDINIKFGLPFETTLEGALEKYDFDAVYISTPIGTHLPLIKLAAKNKKQILCEKSLACNLKEVEEIVTVCKENECALFEGFMYQFHEQHKYIRDLIDKNEIGRPLHFQAWFGFPPLVNSNFRYIKKLGGGAILDAGSYVIHAARHFFGVEPISITSVVENEGHEVDIHGTAMLNFGESRTAHLVFGFDNMYQNKYVIWGTKGVLTLDRAFAIPADFSATLTIEKQGVKENVSMPKCNHFIEELKYFVENYKNSETRNSWYDEVINQSTAIQKILES